MTLMFDLTVIAAGSFVGLVALCVWLLVMSQSGSGWPPPTSSQRRRS